MTPRQEPDLDGEGSATNERPYRVTVVCWGLVAWEALRYSETRARIRTS